MPNVIYQLQIKSNRFFTVPIGCIKNDQNVLCQLALTKVQKVQKYFEISLEIFRKDAKLNFRHKKSGNGMGRPIFFKINIFLQGGRFYHPIQNKVNVIFPMRLSD